MLYQVLPTALQSRIPALPSFRRSINDLRTKGQHGKSNSVPELLRPVTPPPGYTTRPGSGSATPNRLSLTSTTSLFEDMEDDPEEVEGMNIPSAVAAYETVSGVNWQYARHGVSMITQAHQHSSDLFKEDDPAVPSLIRSLYIHGVTWLLRGLPSDLTPDETLSLRAALPQPLSPASANDHALVARGPTGVAMREGPAPEPTVLQRATASIVFHLVMLVHFLLPYVRLLLGHAFEYERKNRITRRVLNSSVSTVDEISRRSVRVLQAICQMNDGKVGEALNRAVVYGASGITGGVQQGLEDALRSEAFRKGS